MKKTKPVQVDVEDTGDIEFVKPNMRIGSGSRIVKGVSGDSKLFFIFRIAFLVALVLFGFWAQNNLIITKSYVFSSFKVPKTFVGYKIAQVSDLHNTSLNVISNVKRAEPDIILFTGGFTDDNGNYKRSVNIVNQLGKIAPTYFVLGDNDSETENEILSSVTNAQFLEDDCIQINAPLINESDFINKYLGKQLVNRANKGDELASDYLEYTKSKLAEDADSYIQVSGFRNGLLDLDYQGLMDYVYNIIGTDKEVFEVAAINQARMFERLSNADIDVIFSGETHGMKGIAGDYTHGLYTLSGTNLFLSAGVGNLSSYKQRIFNFPDVVVVTLSDGTIKDESLLEKFLGLFIYNVSTKFDNDGGFQAHRYQYTSGRLE